MNDEESLLTEDVEKVLRYIGYDKYTVRSYRGRSNNWALDTVRILGEYNERIKMLGWEVLPEQEKKRYKDLIEQRKELKKEIAEDINKAATPYLPKLEKIKESIKEIDKKIEELGYKAVEKKTSKEE